MVSLDDVGWRIRKQSWEKTVPFRPRLRDDHRVKFGVVLEGLKAEVGEEDLEVDFAVSGSHENG